MVAIYLAYSVLNTSKCHFLRSLLLWSVHISPWLNVKHFTINWSLWLTISTSQVYSISLTFSVLSVWISHWEVVKALSWTTFGFSLYLVYNLSVHMEFFWKQIMVMEHFNIFSSFSIFNGFLSFKKSYLMSNKLLLLMISF